MRKLILISFSLFAVGLLFQNCSEEFDADSYSDQSSNGPNDTNNNDDEDVVLPPTCPIGQIQVGTNLDGSLICQPPSAVGPARIVMGLQPTYQSLLFANLVLTVSAEGATPITYQWYKDGAPLAGKTTNQLVLTDLREADSGAYAVFVMNSEQNNAAAASMTNLTVARGPNQILDSQWVAILGNCPTGYIDADITDDNDGQRQLAESGGTATQKLCIRGVKAILWNNGTTCPAGYVDTKLSSDPGEFSLLSGDKGNANIRYCIEGIREAEWINGNCPAGWHHHGQLKSHGRISFLPSNPPVFDLNENLGSDGNYSLCLR